MLFRGLAALLLSWLFIFSAHAGKFEDFSSKRQEQIKKLYSLARDIRGRLTIFGGAPLKVKGDEDDADKLLKDIAADLGENEQGGFTLKDAITTSFDKKNLFFDYCGFNSDYFKPELFATMLDIVGNVDEPRDKNNHSLLMRIVWENPQASLPFIHSLGTYFSSTDYNSFNSVERKCVEMLLEKNASISLTDQFGNDALSLALLRGSPGIIRLVSLDREIINPNTKLLWQIYKGSNPSQEIKKVIEEERVKLDVANILSAEPFARPFILRAYRVANQAMNFDVVREIYDKLDLGAFYKEMKSHNEVAHLFSGHGLYPPLWAKNIVELRDYLLIRLKEMKGAIISPNNLKHIHGNRYVLLKDGKEIDLYKKDGQTGRFFGANYLAQRIDDLGLKDNIGVPRKFLLPLTSLESISGKVLLPFDSQNGGELDLRMDISLQPRNRISFDNFLVFAEFIEYDAVYGIGSKEQRLTPDLVRLIKDTKFHDIGDFGNPNVVRSKIDHKAYFIDTEDHKNFPSPFFWFGIDRRVSEGIWGESESKDIDNDRYVIGLIKSLCFDLRIDDINFIFDKEVVKENVLEKGESIEQFFDTDLTKALIDRIDNVQAFADFILSKPLWNLSIPYLVAASDNQKLHKIYIDFALKNTDNYLVPYLSYLSQAGLPFEPQKEHVEALQHILLVQKQFWLENPAAILTKEPLAYFKLVHSLAQRFAAMGGLWKNEFEVLVNESDISKGLKHLLTK